MPGRAPSPHRRFAGRHRLATALVASAALTATTLSVLGGRVGAAPIRVEPETWTASGPATIDADGSASGGSYVAFTRNTGPDAPLPAFPGAQGFGATTPGGRGGKVMEVTTLADSGTGSLRACAEASGPRVCVFRTGGTIETRSPISIEDPYLTIAGQSAPGGGITLKAAPTYTEGPLEIETHDVVIRYLRVRPGASADEGTMRSGIRFEDGPHHIVLDHLSVSWAVDDNLTLIDGTRDVTVQWSIVSEALHGSSHSEGPHSKGVAISGKKYNATAETGNISLHHNVFAHNDDRNPRNAGFGLVDFVNNVVYNWGSNGFESVDNQAKVPANLVGNSFKQGTDSGDYEVVYDAQGTGHGVSFFVDGNLGPNRTSAAQPQSDIVHPDGRRYVTPTRFPAPPVTTTSAATAYTEVLAGAGAREPYLDPVDARVLGDVRDGTGRVIDSPSEVGGWPALSAGAAPADGDHDGMPDAWESGRGLDPTRDDSGRDRDGDGYTNVEEYLNGLVPSPVTTPPVGCPAAHTGGAVSGTIRVPTGGVYHLWSRVRSPDGVADAYWLEVDGICHEVGGTMLAPALWTWVGHQDARTDRRVTAALTAGEHTVRLVGGSEGLHVDRLLVTPDARCVPSSAGTCSSTRRVGVEARVAARADDAEENVAGVVSLGSSDLDLAVAGTQQVVALRFRDLAIPRSARISRAWLQFTSDAVDTEPTVLSIRAEASDDAAPFTTEAFDLSSRPRTTRAVTWKPGGWTSTGVAGRYQRTRSLNGIISEVVSRPGWNPGNDLVLIIAGTGERAARAYDGAPLQAPLLHLEYRP